MLCLQLVALVKNQLICGWLSRQEIYFKRDSYFMNILKPYIN